MKDKFTHWYLKKAKLTAWRNGNRKCYLCSLITEDYLWEVKDLFIWVDKPSKIREFLKQPIRNGMIKKWKGELVL